LFLFLFLFVGRLLDHDDDDDDNDDDDDDDFFLKSRGGRKNSNIRLQLPPAGKKSGLFFNLTTSIIFYTNPSPTIPRAI